MTTDAQNLRAAVLSALMPDDALANLLVHAEREFDIAETSGIVAYGGMMRQWVTQLLRLIVYQGQDESTIPIALDLLVRLLNYLPLTVNDHLVYIDVSDTLGQPAGSVLRDARDPRYYSTDSAKTWTLVESQQPPLVDPRYPTGDTLIHIFWPSGSLVSAHVILCSCGAGLIVELGKPGVCPKCALNYQLAVQPAPRGSIFAYLYTVDCWVTGSIVPRLTFKALSNRDRDGK